MDSTNQWNIGFWGKMNEELLISRYPVHRACRDGDRVSLSSLLADGKHDLYIEDQFYGWTPAHWAGYYGKLDCLQMLISSGVNSEIATQRFRQSPAHVAAFGSQPNCLMWLVQNGANVNAQDYLGETPSHKAARSGSLECLGILKANGAQFIIKNNNGHVPKDLALSCGNEPSARYIMQVEQCNSINSNVFLNGLCSRKRGISDTNDEEVKKLCADSSMPYAQPVTEMAKENSVPDSHGDCEMIVEHPVLSSSPHETNSSANSTTNTHMKDTTPSMPPLKGPMGDCGQWQRDYWMECYVPQQAPHKCYGLRDNICSDPMSNGLAGSSVPNSVSVLNGNGASNGSTAVITNGSGDASQMPHPQPSKEYVRVYDYLTNWSAYNGSCENHKTLVTDEMETQDAEMTNIQSSDSHDGASGCTTSNSAVEHKDSLFQAQGYDSKLCEAMYDIGYGHAY